MVTILCVGEGHRLSDHPNETGIRLCNECHQAFFQVPIFIWDWPYSRPITES